MTVKRFVEKVCNKIDLKFVVPALAKIRKRKLKNTDFTIISNNCWAGRCYEYFDMPKLSPTIGAYFFAEDYVKFCKNLMFYLSQKMIIISAKESKHYESLIAKGESDVLIGKLNDVEIVFLHYHDKDIVLQKWERRVSRINPEHIILKFSYQNNCTDELIKEFLDIQDFPKFCLVGEKITGNTDEIFFSRHDGKITVDETENFNWFVDPITLINDRLKN